MGEAVDVTRGRPIKWFLRKLNISGTRLGYLQYLMDQDTPAANYLNPDFRCETRERM